MTLSEQKFARKGVPIVRVQIQVIKTYEIECNATNKDEAISRVYDLQSTEIEKHGKLLDVQTDFAIATEDEC